VLLEGPCDEDLLPTASEEDTPPPRDESADEREAVNKGKNSEKEASEEGEPMEEGGPEEEPMEEKT